MRTTALLSGVLLLAVATFAVRAYRGAKPPILAVSQTDSNKVTLLALGDQEYPIGTFPVGCKGPFGLAFADQQRWLYVACWDHSQIALIDTAHRTPTRIFSGGTLPAWMQTRPGSNETWVSDEARGTVTVYRSGTLTSLATIRTAAGPSDITFDTTGRQGWVSNETAGTVSHIDTVHRRKLADIPVGNVPQGMALTQDGKLLLVANFGSSTLSLVDTGTSRQLEQISVCVGPVDVAVARQGRSELAYLSCYKSGTVDIVDVTQRRSVQRLFVGAKPFGIVAHPNQNQKRVYVCVGGTNELVVIKVGQPSRIVRRIKIDGNPLQIAVSR